MLIFMYGKNIINGIKEYDEAHANEERNEEGADVPEL